MKVNNVTKWIVIEHEASSLFNVIAEGEFKQTKAGKELWKSLINGSALQKYCNREGFNIQEENNNAQIYRSYVKVRVGLVANNQDNCLTVESTIGFGTSVRGCNGYRGDVGHVRNTSCGNIAICGYFNNANTAAFGYILVQ